VAAGIIQHPRALSASWLPDSGHAELSPASGSGLLDAITRPLPSRSVNNRSGSAATRALNSLRAMARRRSATELGVSEVILPLGCWSGRGGYFVKIMATASHASIILDDLACPRQLALSPKRWTVSATHFW